jgi:DeoR/GlpR family transcriptional regulator of sugar metabolism
MDTKSEHGSGDQIVGLLSEPRRRRILEWIQEEGSARVRELAEAFRVSDATIRQDLEKLESEGAITREHGGAFLNSAAPQSGPLTLHHQENMDKKRRIGAMAAGLVSDGETLILDAGTTTTEIALRLTSRRQLTVITNALNIAIHLGAVPTFAVHLPGGQFKSPTLSISGDKSVEYFSNIFAGKLFLATAGVDLDAGLTYPSFADLQLKEAMIKAAAHVYLVADSTKIGKSSFTRLGSLDVIHSLITDDGISDRVAKEFERRGVEVLIAR